MRPNRLYTILAVVMTLIIWINAVMPGTISSAQSGWVTGVFNLFFTWVGINIDPDILHVLIRIFAHFIQYLILAFLWTLAWANVFDKLIKRLLYPLSLVILTAWIDETIQLFTEGRAFQLSDIGVDLLGAFVGMAMAVLVGRAMMRRL